MDRIGHTAWSPLGRNWFKTKIAITGEIFLRACLRHWNIADAAAFAVLCGFRI
jgi:hypothetical protein